LPFRLQEFGNITSSPSVKCPSFWSPTRLVGCHVHKKHTGQWPPLLIMTYTYLDADNHNSPTLEKQDFLPHKFLNYNGFGKNKTKVVGLNWGLLKLPNSNIVGQISRVKQNSKVEQVCYPMFNNKIGKGGEKKREIYRKDGMICS